MYIMVSLFMGLSEMQPQKQQGFAAYKTQNKHFIAYIHQES